MNTSLDTNECRDGQSKKTFLGYIYLAIASLIIVVN